LYPSPSSRRERTERARPDAQSVQRGDREKGRNNTGFQLIKTSKSLNRI